MYNESQKSDIYKFEQSIEARMSHKYVCVYDKPPTPTVSSDVSSLNQEWISNGTQQSQGVNGANANASVVTSRNPGQWSSSYRIRSPQYQVYSIRLASFTHWPNDIRQRPEQVADAGFYYTGLQDVVRCFACDGGLKNWDPDDDPWIEHARWFSQCPFVKRVKGQKFIDLVRRTTEESDEEEDAVVHSTFQPNNPMADTPNLRNELNPQLDQENEQSVLETEAAKKCVTESVTEMGFSRDVVARAINELLNRGKTEYTSSDIVEVILELDDKGQLPSGDQRETSLPNPGPSAQITGSVQRHSEENQRLRKNMHCVRHKNTQASEGSANRPIHHTYICSDEHCTTFDSQEDNRIRMPGSMVNENCCKVQAKQIPSSEANTDISSNESLYRDVSTNIRLYRNVIRNETYRMMSGIDMVMSEAEQLFGLKRSQIFFDLLAAELCHFGSAGAISEFVPNMAESTVRQNVTSFFEQSWDTMNRLMTLLLRYPDSKILQQMPVQNFISLMKSVIKSSQK